MLKVPNLKPGQTPFDPSIHSITQPLNNHPLNLPASTPPADDQSAPTPIDTLTHSLIKDALTTLHQEDDTQFATLQTYSAQDLPNLVKDHENFLNNQRTKFKNQFPTEEQKRLFLDITKPYFNWSQEKSQTLYIQKINKYRIEVIEKQNTEFLNRALRPETAFDDHTQTLYRDMLLFNLENLYQHLPEQEKQTRLDTAAHTFYKKVIEKRLELDPSQVEPLLHTPAVQRVLSPDERSSYKTMAKNAIRIEQHKTTAQKWLDQGTTPKKDTEKELLSIYNHLHYLANRKQVLTRLVNAMNVWKIVLDNGATAEAIPSWVTRVDANLRDHLIHELDTRNQKGGLPGDIDYTKLLDITTDFNIIETVHHLTDEKEFHSCIQKLGGLSSEAFAILARFITGNVTEDDNLYLTQLNQAKQYLSNHTDKETAKTATNAFIKRFDAILQIHAINNDGKKLDESEIANILSKMPLPDKPE